MIWIFQHQRTKRRRKSASVSRSLARSLARPLVIHSPSIPPTITSLHRHRSTLVSHVSRYTVRFHRVNYGLT